jgi:hypothetical protein
MTHHRVQRARLERPCLVAGVKLNTAVYTEEAEAIILVAASPDGFAILVMAVTAGPG